MIITIVDKHKYNHFLRLLLFFSARQIHTRQQIITWITFILEHRVTPYYNMMMGIESEIKGND